MRRALWLACAFLLVSPAVLWPQSNLPPLPRTEPVNDARIDRLTEWLRAVETHRPGVEDQAFESISGWSGDDLQGLLTDATSLITLIANPRASRFSVEKGDARRTEIGYTREQLDRLRALACLGAGAIEEERCPDLANGRPADAILFQLAAHAAAARRSGDRNYVARRAALLHTDVATIGELTAQPARLGASLRVTLADGRLAGVQSGAEHWEIARAALDRVIPAGAAKPAPRRDRMVHDWYVATASWMEGNLRHSTEHLDRAREIFPDDPDLLFLSGCQHEAYASPEVQEPMRRASHLPGLKFRVGSEKHELEQAERFFRRVLVVRPAMDEARVRLGHVLLQQRRYEDAAGDLRPVAERVADPQLRYYAQMFTGAAEEALSHFDRSRTAYERASELYPSAQSPHIALSALAWRRGDRAAALKFYDRMFSVSDADPASDPWWSYYESEVRDPDALLEAIRRSMLRVESP